MQSPKSENGQLLADMQKTLRRLHTVAGEFNLGLASIEKSIEAMGPAPVSSPKKKRQSKYAIDPDLPHGSWRKPAALKKKK